MPFNTGISLTWALCIDMPLTLIFTLIISSSLLLFLPYISTLYFYPIFLPYFSLYRLRCKTYTKANKNTNDSIPRTYPNALEVLRSLKPVKDDILTDIFICSASSTASEIIISPSLDTADMLTSVSYTHLRAHETRHDLVCRLLLERYVNLRDIQYPLRRQHQMCIRDSIHMFSIQHGI